MLERVFYRPAKYVYFTDQNQNFFRKSKILIKSDILTKFEVNWSSQSVRIAKFVILTLVCKIHAPDRWPKNFTKFLISTPKVVN